MSGAETTHAIVTSPAFTVRGGSVSTTLNNELWTSRWPL